MRPFLEITRARFFFSSPFFYLWETTESRYQERGCSLIDSNRKPREAPHPPSSSPSSSRCRRLETREPRLRISLSSWLRLYPESTGSPRGSAPFPPSDVIDDTKARLRDRAKVTGWRESRGEESKMAPCFASLSSPCAVVRQL